VGVNQVKLLYAITIPTVKRHSTLYKIRTEQFISIQVNNQNLIIWIFIHKIVSNHFSFLKSQKTFKIKFEVQKVFLIKKYKYCL